MKISKFPIAFAAACLALSSLAISAQTLTAGAQEKRAPAPWSARPLAAKVVPAVYLTEWKKAKNRTQCAPLVLLGADQQAGVKLRRADFSDGWAVAYDLPGSRSDFGIAGTGVDVDNDGKRYRFPHSIDWADGSNANYGPQGGTGPEYLAYLTVEGQQCLYNVWSKRGKAHLEQLLGQLRRVDAKR